MSDMQEEINEILDKLYLNFEKAGLTVPEYSDLRDYITNLQEELKSANESITWWSNRFNAIQKENEKLKDLCDKYEKEHSTEFKIWKDERHQLLDYKSRNEKAIEYLEHEQFKRIQLGFGRDKYLENIKNEAINILQGVDKE